MGVQPCSIARTNAHNQIGTRAMAACYAEDLANVCYGQSPLTMLNYHLKRSNILCGVQNPDKN